MSRLLVDLPNAAVWLLLATGWRSHVFLTSLTPSAGLERSGNETTLVPYSSAQLISGKLQSAPGRELVLGLSINTFSRALIKKKGKTSQRCVLRSKVSSLKMWASNLRSCVHNESFIIVFCFDLFFQLR